MLRKLIKHEIKATIKPLIIITIAVSVIGLVFWGSFRLVLAGVLPYLIEAMVTFNNNVDTSPLEEQFPYYISSIVLSISAILLIGAIVTVFIILLHRFYKSMFTREGYLTFTLPVSTGSLIFSKTITATISLIFIILSVIIFPLLYNGIFELVVTRDIWSTAILAKEIFINTFFHSNNGVLYGLEQILWYFLCVVTIIIVAYLGITISNTGSGKKKGFLGGFISVGVYVAAIIAHFVLKSLCSDLFYFVKPYVSDNKFLSRLAMQINTVPRILLLAGVILTSYIIIKGRIDKKLNLQ